MSSPSDALSGTVTATQDGPGMSSATYSFCEPVHATGVRWHIRELDSDGQKFGGGVKVAPLCYQANDTTWTNGWDINVDFRPFHHADIVCPRCLAEYIGREMQETHE